MSNPPIEALEYAVMRANGALKRVEKVRDWSRGDILLEDQLTKAVDDIEEALHSLNSLLGKGELYAGRTANRSLGSPGQAS